MQETAVLLENFEITNPDDILVRDSRTKDETGRRYGKLVVTGLAGSDTSKGNVGGALWHCRCDCGGTKTVRGGQLRQGKVVTCGQCTTRGNAVQRLKETAALYAPPCERGCLMFDACRVEYLACKPYREWIRTGNPNIKGDPEKHPPSPEEFAKCFPAEDPDD
jgi:hypothetical protein